MVSLELSLILYIILGVNQIPWEALVGFDVAPQSKDQAQVPRGQPYRLLPLDSVFLSLHLIKFGDQNCAYTLILCDLHSYQTQNKYKFLRGQPTSDPWAWAACLGPCVSSNLSTPWLWCSLRASCMTVVEVVVGILYSVFPSTGTQCSYPTASNGSIWLIRHCPQVATSISSKDFSLIVLQPKWDIPINLWLLCMLSCVQLFEAPWSLACQAPLSMEFSRQEYWNGWPFPSPGDLPNTGTKPITRDAQCLTGVVISHSPRSGLRWTRQMTNIPFPSRISLFILTMTSCLAVPGTDE